MPLLMGLSITVGSLFVLYGIERILFGSSHGGALRMLLSSLFFPLS